MFTRKMARIISVQSKFNRIVFQLSLTSILKKINCELCNSITRRKLESSCNGKMIDHQTNINVIKSMPAEENYKCSLRTLT